MNTLPPFQLFSRLAAHLSLLALASVLIPSALAAGPQDFLPRVLPWQGSSEALMAKADDPWITPSEKTGLSDTPSYDETIAYLMRLTNASPLLALREFGRTAQGRALYVVVATRNREGISQPDGAAGRPALLAQAGIHAGEIDGKDAGLMLLRDIAVGGKAALVDNADFLLVPMVNPDGHERISEWNRPNQRGPIHPGWRTSAQNLNLNRDYMKADTPEMQALLMLISQRSPSLCLDVHVTDGIDYQYDITFGYHGDNGGFAWSPHIAAWLNQHYRPGVEAALKTAGHIPGPLIFERDERDLTKGLTAPPSMPRFSHAYGDLRHLPTVLVENHSLKPYRQRVLGTYVLIEASLRTLAAHAAGLQQAVLADQTAARPTLPMNWIRGGGERIMRDFLGIAYETYTSPATGGLEVRWLGTPKLYADLPVFLPKPGVDLVRPKAYWVPGAKTEVIARLRLHGIRMERLPAAQRVDVEMYRLVNPQPQPGQGSHPYEGRHTLRTGVKAERRTETFPAGSVRVPTDQPLGDLAVALLEPQSNDSFFAWGFFLETLQRVEYMEGYVLAPLAEQMLATDPKLNAEFETKLANDQEFSTNPEARRQWFYERTQSHDDRYLLYPVGIER